MAEYDILAAKYKHLGIKNKKVLWHVVYGYPCGRRKHHGGYKFERVIDNKTLEFVCGCGRSKLVKCKNTFS